MSSFEEQVSTRKLLFDDGALLTSAGQTNALKTFPEVSLKTFPEVSLKTFPEVS